MRFIRIQGALTAVALLATLPAFGQATTPPPAAAAPTLTPPGSSTSVPLLPDSSATTPGALPDSTLPGALPSSGTLPGANLPPASLSMPNLSGLGGLGGGSDLTSILAGSSSTPLTLTLGQLDSHWRRMTVGGNLDLGSISQVISSVMGSAGLGVYYTKGETVSVGDATYLIAYRPRLNIRDITGMTNAMSSGGAAAKPPTPPKLTAQTPLSLSLLNLQTVGSLTDIRPFSLAAEVADSAAAARAFNDMAQSLATAALSAAMTPHPGAAGTGTH